MKNQFLAIRTNPENLNHHLWLNNGVWALAFTVHTPDGRKRRVRRCLGLKREQVFLARERRDAVLAGYQTEPREVTPSTDAVSVTEFSGNDFSVPIKTALAQARANKFGRAALVTLAFLILRILVSEPVVAADPQSQAAPPAIIFIDDVSSPTELKQHGIEPFDPEGLAYAFDAVAVKNVPCTLIYVPIRQQASRVVPVVIEVPANKEEPPPVPERGLKLPDLQKSWLAYRQAKLTYDERLQFFEAQREEARQKFIIRSLDALAAAETEISALRRSRGSYRASDIEGAILNSLATARTIRSSSVILVLNSDLIDEPGHRRSRTAPLTEEELPPTLVRGLILVNSSFKPDGAPLISKTSIPKHHTQSLKTAADLVANLVPGVK